MLWCFLCKYMRAQPEDEVRVEEVALKFTLVADGLDLMFQDTNGQLRNIFPYNGVFPRLIPRNYDNCDKFVVVGFAHGLARSAGGGDQPAEAAQTSGANLGMNFYYLWKLVGGRGKNCLRQEFQNITITFYSLEILIFN